VAEGDDSPRAENRVRSDFGAGGNKKEEGLQFKKDNLGNKTMQNISAILLTSVATEMKANARSLTRSLVSNSCLPELARKSHTQIKLETLRRSSRIPIT
jgi:hypothetical protein